MPTPRYLMFRSFNVGLPGSDREKNRDVHEKLCQWLQKMHTNKDFTYEEETLALQEALDSSTRGSNKDLPPNLFLQFIINKWQPIFEQAQQRQAMEYNQFYHTTAHISEERGVIHMVASYMPEKFFLLGKDIANLLQNQLIVIGDDGLAKDIDIPPPTAVDLESVVLLAQTDGPPHLGQRRQTADGHPPLTTGAAGFSGGLFSHEPTDPTQSSDGPSAEPAKGPK